MSSKEEEAQDRKAALRALALKQQQAFVRKKPVNEVTANDFEIASTKSADARSVAGGSITQASTTEGHLKKRDSSASLDSKVSKGTTVLTTGTHQKAEIYIEEKDYKLALLKSKLLTHFPNWRSYALKGRLEKYESMLKKLRDPVDGVQFKDGGGLFGAQPLCATGYDIAVWFLKELKALDPADAKLMIQNMVDYGYIIPLDDNQIVYREDDSLYTYQADFFYPSKAWDVSDVDFYAFLKRQSSLSSDQQYALDSLKTSMEFKQDLYREVKEKQKQHLSKLTRNAKKLFELREKAFWKYWKPAPSSRLYVEESPINEIKKKRYDQAKYEKKLTDDKLLQYLTRQNENLLASISLYRLPCSAAIKNLMVRVDLWMRFDPLARPDRFKDNAWFESATTPFVEAPLPEVPTYSHARLWTLGLRDVLQDPLGVKYFMSFLEKDFSTENLKFYLECQQLDQILDRKEFYDKCSEICSQFVAIGSPHELNLLAGTRDKIVSDIASAASTPEQLSIYVLSDAYDHILHLMHNSSYPRFLQSAEIKAIMSDQ